VEDPELRDKDEWNLIGASGMCLEKMAEILKHEILPQVEEYITFKFKNGASSPDKWIDKYVASMVLGCVIQGQNN
jgi:hypothetical protein